MRRHRWRRPAASLVVLVALGSVTAGCGGDAPAAGPASAPAGSDPTAAGVTTGDDEDDVTSFRGLADGYPSDEVPLVPRGRVVSSTERSYDEVTAYSVVVRTPTAPRPSLRAALDTLVEAGLRGDTGLPPGSGTRPPRTVHSKDYDLVVVLSGVSAGTGTLLTYTVELS